MLADDNVFPKIIGAEQGSDPAPPSAGERKFYAKSDGWYDEDSAGVVTGPLGAGGGGGGASGFTQLRKSASQTITASTWTAVTWDTEDVDTLAGHDNVTNNSRITVPTAGVYGVNFSLAVSASPSDLFLQLGVNGTRVPGRLMAAGGSNKSWTLSRQVSLGAGAYVEAFVYGAGGNVVTTTFSDDECLMSVFRIGTV